jgi:hypothetical protein
MRKYSLLDPSFVSIIVILLIGMSITSANGSYANFTKAFQQSIDVENNFYGKSNEQFWHTICDLSGTFGEDGWYISDVTVTLTVVEEPLKGTYHTFYRIDGASWEEYFSPFNVSEDGVRFLVYYSVDEWGNAETSKTRDFKIDQTPPKWNGLYFDRIGHSKYRIHAYVSDTTSGVNRVEFYLNDYLIYTDDEAPYEWIYKGPSFSSNAIVFDEAGNFALPSLIPLPPMTYVMIGTITNPQFYNYTVVFLAKFVIVFEHSTLHFHISTLTNQLFAIATNHIGYINENFMIIRYSL